ncbi:MAG TPA: hypothetical protein VFM46_12470 [Pseudomonadales bacterium]|nr:hypothetical protein [Pseudomonadales bacterium]
MAGENVISAQVENLEAENQQAVAAAQAAEVAAVAAVEAAATAQQIAQQEATQQAAHVVAEVIEQTASNEDEIKWTKTELEVLKGEMNSLRMSQEQTNQTIAEILEVLKPSAPATPSLPENADGLPEVEPKSQEPQPAPAQESAKVRRLRRL